jgi:hypothetical protein
MEENLCCYVYGIIRNCGGTAPLPDRGIEEARPVRLISEGTIAAAVSDVSPDEFGAAALESRISEAEWITAKAQLHVGVLTGLAAGAVVPMRFCTIFRDETSVRELLRSQRADLVAALDRLEGKEEWAVKVYCNRPALDKTAADLCEAAASLKAQLAGKPEGTGYLLRKKLESLVSAQAERTLEDAMCESFTRLAQRSDAAVTNPPQRKEATGRDDEMILNAAYLVLRERLDEFQAEVAALGNERGSFGFTYELSGPWPPYNFVNSDATEAAADGDISA